LTSGTENNFILLILSSSNMPTKRKREVKVKAVPYAKGFQLPTGEQISNALGAFPYDGENPTRKLHREESLLSTGGGGRTSLESIRQLNNRVLFENSNSSWGPLPPLRDADSWLAKFYEKGQTMSQYTDMVTMRSGHFKPSERATRPTIYIVPIVEDTGTSTPQWPNEAPNLNNITELVSIFFDRPVTTLPYIVVKPRRLPAGNCIAWKTIGNSYNNASDIRGRVHEQSGHFQIELDELLHKVIAPIQSSGMHAGSRFCDNFAVVGVTMLDLYDNDASLFMAGGACMQNKTAVLSLARYNPRIKSSYYHWYDYGYLPMDSMLWKTNSGYFDGNRRPIVTSGPPSRAADDDSNNDANTDVDEQNVAIKTLYFLRAAKLIVHEIGHLYGLEHCVYYACNMNGTANLIEDFAAPLHWCGNCLRKLHYRIGFDMRERYRKLANLYIRMGMTSEATWVQQRLDTIAPSAAAGVDACGDASGALSLDAVPVLVPTAGDDDEVVFVEALPANSIALKRRVPSTLLTRNCGVTSAYSSDDGDYNGDSNHTLRRLNFTDRMTALRSMKRLRSTDE
jgi:predicted Zn-dependent protease